MPKLLIENYTDDAGYPQGGHVTGPGFHVEWQSGPVRRESDKAINPPEYSGAIVEDLLEAARARLAFYQEAVNGKLRCRETACAITKIDEALHWLKARQEDRKARGVAGTLQP